MILMRLRLRLRLRRRYRRLLYPMGSSRDLRPEMQRREVEREITKIDLSRDGIIGVRAEGLAQDLPGDGRDLLHEAICRALTSRQFRETATVDQFLRGIMRSIASTARRSRERRGEQHVGYPVDDLVERMALGGYVAQSAEDIIETERVRQLCADVLEQLAAVSDIQAALIEGIGLNLRGQDLADYLGLSISDLGTVRRGLKRKVQRIWPRFERLLNPNDAFKDDLPV